MSGICGQDLETESELIRWHSFNIPGLDSTSEEYWLEDLASAWMKASTVWPCIFGSVARTYVLPLCARRNEELWSYCSLNFYMQISDLLTSTPFLIQFDLCWCFTPNLLNQICMLVWPHCNITFKWLRNTHPAWNHRIQRIDALPINILFRDVECPKDSTNVEEQRLLRDMDTRAHSSTSTIRDVISLVWISRVEICCCW